MVARSDFINVDVQVLGGERFDRMLGIAASAVSDLRPAWKEIRHIYTRNRRAEFRSQGHHAAGGWAPLTPRYEERERRFGPKAILRKSDRLFRGLTNPSHPDFIFRSQRQQMAIGVANRVASYHQLGTSRMAQRKVIAFNEAERRRWTEAIHEHVFNTDQFKRLNLGAPVLPRPAPAFA